MFYISCYSNETRHFKLIWVCGLIKLSKRCCPSLFAKFFWVHTIRYLLLQSHWVCPIWRIIIVPSKKVEYFFDKMLRNFIISLDIQMRQKHFNLIWIWRLIKLSKKLLPLLICKILLWSYYKISVTSKPLGLPKRISGWAAS